MSESYARYWSSFWSESEIRAAAYATVSAGERERVETIINLVPGDVTTVLDVGCGSGLVVNELLARRDVKASGLDISAAALEHVQAERILGSTDQMPVEDRSFDVLILADVLEHLEQGPFEATLGEIGRIAGRYVVVNSPHRETLELARTRCQRCTTAFHSSRHVRSIEIDDVVEWLPDFELVESRLCGERRPFRLRKLQLFAQAIGDVWYRPKHAVCPNCGYHVQPPAPQRVVWLANGVLQRLAAAVGPSRPSEFVALLRRR